MVVDAVKINKILKKYGYKLVFDKLHSDKELRKCIKSEKNFNKKKYLTIKNKDSLVIGRIYTHNSDNNIPLEKVILNEEEIDKIVAFFKFFDIKGSKKIVEEIVKLTNIDAENIDIDLIINNVLPRGETSQKKQTETY